MSIPITPGTGAASVAAEAVSGLQYQRIEVTGLGGGSIMAVNPDGAINVSVLGVPKVEVVSSVAVSVTPAANQSVSGTVGASVVGHAPVVIVGGSVAVAVSPAANQSVSGTVGASVIGWVPVQTSNTSVISYVQNSVATVIIGGSIAASVTPAANQSVSGTVGASVIGHAPVVIVGGSIAASFTPPANQSVSGAVTANQGTNPWIITGSVQGSFSPAANQSVSGTVGASVIGWVPIQPSNTSIISIWPAPSIVGTYAEDTAHTPADRGIFTLGVRNDTLASVSSATGDYGQFAVGPSGETITANAPLTSWVRGTADLRGSQGASVTAIAAQGASVFTYITGVQVANMGSASVLVTLAGGLGSILGYTIAPAGGGSNIVYPNALKTGANSAFTASISGTASVLVSAQGFTAGI